MRQSMQTILKAGSHALMVAVVMTSGCQQKPDPSLQLKPIVDKYVEVWNSGSLDGLDAIMDPHFVRHANLQPDVEGPDGLKKVISGFRAAYPDVKIVLTDWIYSENESAGRWSLTGTNSGAGEMPPTGKSVKVGNIDSSLCQWKND